MEKTRFDTNLDYYHENQELTKRLKLLWAETSLIKRDLRRMSWVAALGWLIVLVYILWP